MNRIVRKHYPLANLPDDLREGFDAAADVIVTVEETQRPASEIGFDRALAKRRPPYRSQEEIDAFTKEQRAEPDEL